MKLRTTLAAGCMYLFAPSPAMADNQTLLAEIKEAMQPGFLYRVDPPEFIEQAADVQLVRLNADTLVSLSFLTGTALVGPFAGEPFCLITENHIVNGTQTSYNDVNCDGQVDGARIMNSDDISRSLQKDVAEMAYAALLPKVRDLTRLNWLLSYSNSNIDPHWGWGALANYSERRPYTAATVRILAEKYGNEREKQLGSFIIRGPNGSHAHLASNSLQGDHTLCISQVYDMRQNTTYMAKDLHCDGSRLTEQELMVDVGNRGTQTTYLRASERHGADIMKSGFDKAYAVLHFLSMHYPELFE